MIEISTSILDADKEDAVQIFYDLEVAKTDYYHIDVMDGKFVGNNTINIMNDYTNVLKQITQTPLDIHLMVEDVENFVKAYSVFNPLMITFHYEAIKEQVEKNIQKQIEEKGKEENTNLENIKESKMAEENKENEENKEKAISDKIFEIINLIKEYGIKPGIAISPDTKVREIYKFLPFINNVLVMTVVPGKGGQKLIEDCLKKVEILKEYEREKNLDFFISVDGGVNLSNIEEVKKAGIDIAVVGSGILKTENFRETISKLKNKV